MTHEYADGLIIQTRDMEPEKPYWQGRVMRAVWTYNGNRYAVLWGYDVSLTRFWDENTQKIVARFLRAYAKDGAEDIIKNQRVKGDLFYQKYFYRKNINWYYKHDKDHYDHLVDKNGWATSGYDTEREPKGGRRR
jgi:hypothetical protein